MKLKVITTFAFLLLITIVYQFPVAETQSKPDGAPAGHTGSPGDGLATCTSCHQNVPKKTGTKIITSNIPSTGYVPGTIYTITAKVKSPSVSRFGFQISPQNVTTGALMGTLIVTNVLETKLVGSGKYITHTLAGNSGSGTKTWKFNWQAPPVHSGKVKFYGAFLFANNNNKNTGDTTYTSALIKYEDTIPGPLVFDESRFHESLSSNVNSALKLSVFPNPFITSATIQTNTLPGERFDLDVYSINGKLIFSQHGLVNDGVTQTGSDLKPGVYIFKIASDSGSAIARIVKTH